MVAAEAEQGHVFAVVTEEVGRLLKAATCNMVRYEPGDEAVVAGAWSTGGVRAVPLGTRVALDAPTVATLIRRSEQPERVDSYEGMGGSTVDLLRELGFRSTVGAPIKLAGRLWGAVMVSTVEEQPLPEGSEQRVADFAELVALALANAEAREQLAASRARIVAAGDDERRRIERNLHDGAQQRLVTLSLTLRLAGKRLADGDPAAPELLRSAEGDLAEALEELRELARGIHPSILSDHGLVPALEMLAGRATVPVELSVRLEEQRLPDPVEAAAYYLVAEALTNAAKHARAERGARGPEPRGRQRPGRGGRRRRRRRRRARRLRRARPRRPRRGAGRHARAAQPRRRGHDAQRTHPLPLRGMTRERLRLRERCRALEVGDLDVVDAAGQHEQAVDARVTAHEHQAPAVLPRASAGLDDRVHAGAAHERELAQIEHDEPRLRLRVGQRAFQLRRRRDIERP